MSQHQETSIFSNIHASLQHQLIRIMEQLDVLAAGQKAMNARLDALEAKYSAPQAPQSDPPFLTSPAKKKRNQKTRQQYKKKAQAQRVTIQEVEHLYGQEMEHLDVQISVEKASKHEALIKSVAWNGIPTVATSWHAVISCVGMTSFDGMIMVQNGIICMRRMGVG